MQKKRRSSFLYSHKELYKQEENYTIVGLCMEVHRILGPGLLEIVYKDALELEFKNAKIEYSREKEYAVNYKGIILSHKFYADFVIFDKIILEIKSCKSLNDEHIAQCLNYLKVSNNKLALLINFGESRLNYKRIIL